MTPEDAVTWFEELTSRKLSQRPTELVYTRSEQPVMEYDHFEAVQWVSEAETALRSVFSSGHVLHVRWASVLPRADDEERGFILNERMVDAARALIRTGLKLIQDGRLTSLLDGLRAETVGELLEQAELLNAKGYVVASAVVAGGALETHLLHLCDRAGCLPDDPKRYSISRFETKLAQERNAGREVITATDGKSVTSWGGLRNDAAHKPREFERSTDELRLMIEGIRQFVSRYP